VLAEVAQAVLGSLNRLPDEERQVLVGTLRTWLACGGSTEATAKALSCHPSIVRYRLNQALRPLLRRVTDSESGCEPNTQRGSPRS
jgi:DNA-binding PucR family transcriptional regulator